MDSGPKNWRSGEQMDMEKLADDLERLAQGIRDDAVANVDIQTTDDIGRADIAHRTVHLTFAYTDEYDDCLRPAFRDV